MVRNEFLMIEKSVLPPFFEQVINAVKMIKCDGKSVSQACALAGISRSSFYKYKDKVFELSTEYVRKAIISIKAENERGVLSNVLNSLATFKGNVLTINQDMPIHNIAYITVTLDVSTLEVSIYELLDLLKKLVGIKDVSLLAFE